MPGLGQLGQTITVINNSGKVVSTSKQIVNVFKEARSAYRERKAEIRASRSAEFKEKQARHALEGLKLADDSRSRTSSRARDPNRTKSRHRRKPTVARSRTDGFYAADRGVREGSRFDPDDDGSHGQRGELIRRHTDGPAALGASRPSPLRSTSTPDVDMDLAYGEVPPPLPVAKRHKEDELHGQLSSLTKLLDEAHCLQHSATAIIDKLQRDPDALAAVALALAEISKLARGLAPGALAAMKGSFPAAVTLLASPQFMVAAGVGVGVTVVALGGYKIIKKIKERRDAEAEAEAQVEELREIGGDMSRIEMWQRGIAEAEATSIGTSVDGEFITPMAGRQLIDAGVLLPEQINPPLAEDGREWKRERRERRKRGSERAPKSTRSGRSTADSTPRGSKEGKARKKKEPSGLRLLFKH